MDIGQSPMETLDINARFWGGRKVFLTGHTGFKGSWLSLWLQQLGADLTGYALHPPTEPSLFEAARVGTGMRSIVADIRDADRLSDAMRSAKPEVVIHMAAQALVRESYADPVGTYSTNVMGTVHVLEAARRVDTVRAVLIVTSDKCYENRDWVWGYREIEPMGGFDPYSSSKGCAELVTAAYRKSFFPSERHAEHGVAIATARAGNVIGGGDWAADRLIPDILRAISSAQAAVIRNPLAIRPWQHVLEPLSGYLLLAQKLVETGAPFADGWNFGPTSSDARPVSWIADRLTSLWGTESRWVVRQETGGHEAHQLRLDSTKAQQLLGWSPRWRLERAIDSIVAWHRNYHDGGDMRATTIKQIAEFTSDG